MPKFVIEREIPGAGKLTADQLQAISQKSCGVLKGMPAVQWVQSYVTDDKIYCVYIAPDEAAVREHAKQGGFPANSVSRIRTSTTTPDSAVIPATAQMALGIPAASAITPATMAPATKPRSRHSRYTPTAEPRHAGSATSATAARRVG